MRPHGLAIMTAERARVASWVCNGLGSLGPSKRVRSVRVQLAVSPLAATLAEHVELPVRGVGGCGREDGVGSAGVGAGGAVATFIIKHDG